MNETTTTTASRWRRRLGTRGFGLAALGGYLAVVSFLSLNPWVRPVSEAGMLSPDKLDHALVYGGLTVIVYFFLRTWRGVNGRRSLWAWPWAIGAATLIGILIEIAQSLFTANRTGSVEDAVANAIGAVLGFLAFHAVKYLYARSIMRNRRCPF